MSEIDRYSVDIIQNGRCLVCNVIVPDAQKEMHVTGKKHAKAVLYNPVRFQSSVCPTAPAADGSNTAESNNNGSGGMLGSSNNRLGKFSSLVDCPPDVTGHVIGVKGAGLIAIQEQVGYNCTIGRNSGAGPKRKKDGDCSFFIQATRQSAADEAAALLSQRIKEAVELIEAGRLKTQEMKEAKEQRRAAREAAAASGEAPAPREKKEKKPKMTVEQIFATTPGSEYIVNMKCIVCGVKVYPENMALHLSGKKHINKVKAWLAAGNTAPTPICIPCPEGEKKPESATEDVAVVGQKRERPPDDSAENTAAPAAKRQRFDPDQPIISNGRCNLCNVEIHDSAKRMEIHLNGRKHKEALKAAGLAA